MLETEPISMLPVTKGWWIWGSYRCESEVTTKISLVLAVPHFSENP